ncbi:hypothetical protein K440DRAFT_639902 [Wilcoxina mikolae CBS 423.85]|nr:hypothetical protein K440DRAFT_639902 [Wilcoxina mikolae CBS 423.85]
MTTTTNNTDELSFTDADSQAIVTFWFGPDYSLTSNNAPPESRIKTWFLHTPEFARTCSIFTPLLTLLTTSYTPTTIPTLATTPTRALSLLVLLSQLPRIILPGSREIYTLYDPLACAIAAHALEPSRRYDLTWKHSPAVRMWFLMAWGQSEDLAVQERVGRLAGEMVKDAGEVVDGVWDGERVGMAMNVLRFFDGRREEIGKWGRFRERDEVLERAAV